VITALPDGGYVATWMSQTQDGDEFGIFQQIYDDAGNALTSGESQVNTYTVARQGEPDVALLADGGWVVTWESQGQDGDQGGVYMQRFAADGTAFGSETRVNSVTADDQGVPAIAAMADGGWVIVYQCWTNAGIDIRMMRYDADGLAVGDETVISDPSVHNNTAPDIVALADGGWVVSWHNSAADGNDYGVQQRHFAADVDGTSGDDSLSGTAWGENISGLGGHDTLLGGAGADVLDGGTGNDNMTGGDGDDAYVIDSADDTVTEAEDKGTDTVSTSVGLALGANFENLTLTGTDDLSGTGNSLDNAITGNDGANTLSGLEGSDTLSGGDGDDTLDGGAGNDSMVGGDGDDAYVVD